MTIAEALNVQNRSVSQRDAEVLLAAALNVDRAYLHAHPDEEVSAGDTYETYLKRREANEPVAYITGVKEFYGRPFICDKRGLIPRPETEHLVEHALAWLKPGMSVLELGTGCGAIAVTLAAEGNFEIVATDIAPEALELAQENFQKLGRGAAPQFIVADLFDHPLLTGTFDLIIANLPYVETTWQVETGAQRDVVFYEPDVALFGGEDGLDIYRRFFAEAPAHLKPGGAVMIEYGDTQTSLITPLAGAAFPSKELKVHQDYAGLDRVITLT